MRTSLLAIFLVVYTGTGWSAEKKELENLPSHWQEFNIAGGINGNGYLELEPSYSVMFNRMLGLTAGINLMYGVADSNFYNYYTNSYEDRILDVKTLLFRPALRLRAPIARQHKDKAELFALNIEPGLYIPAGREDFSPNLIADKLGNKRLDWCYFNLRSYLTLDLCPIFVSIGYSVTDFSHQVDEYRLTHTGFLQIGFAF